VCTPVHVYTGLSCSITQDMPALLPCLGSQPVALVLCSPSWRLETCPCVGPCTGHMQLCGGRPSVAHCGSFGTPCAGCWVALGHWAARFTIMQAVQHLHTCTPWLNMGATDYSTTVHLRQTGKRSLWCLILHGITAHHFYSFLREGSKKNFRPLLCEHKSTRAIYLPKIKR